LLQHKLQLQLL